MKNVISKKLGNHIAQQLIESITEPANNIYYVVASKHTPYIGGDDNIPTPYDTESEMRIKLHEEMVFGKKVTASDVVRMVRRYDYVANTVYTPYDQDDQDLLTKQFYTVVDGGSYYYVYKVLDNYKGAQSTETPSSTSETACNFITTADNYTWKLLYKVDEATFEKFATADYMPVYTSSNVASASVSGAIDIVSVNTPGSNYVSVLTGQFGANDLRDYIPDGGDSTTYRLNANAAANSNFYTSSSLYITGGTGAGQIRSITSYNAVTRVISIDTPFDSPPSTDSTYLVTPRVRITGDGTGAEAYAAIASNSTVSNYVDKVVIVNRGYDYTYASAVVAGNTGGVSNNAVLKVVIPPTGGHGTDTPSELGSSQLGVSVTFSNTEGGFISTENDYRKIALLKDPKFNNITLSLSNNISDFTVSENVHQINYKLLTGTVATNSACTTVSGLSTDFSNAFQAGDKVIFFDTINSIQCLRTVTAIANSTSMTVDNEPTFNADFATYAYTSILATAKKSGNSTPYVQLANVEPKFVTGKPVIGESSGAWGVISNITNTEPDKSYDNWLTFDNRYRYAYTSVTGTLVEDANVYQVDAVLANGVFHSANDTFAAFTSVKGPINADPSQPVGSDQGFTITLGSVRYDPEIQNGSGEVLYIENSYPISRSNTQSETIKLILEF